MSETTAAQFWFSEDCLFVGPVGECDHGHAGVLASVNVAEGVADEDAAVGPDGDRIRRMVEGLWGGFSCVGDLCR